MCDRNERLLLANSFAEPTILFSQVGAFTVGCSMSCFQQGRSQPPTAFPCFARQSLACTDFIARAHPRPRCEMTITGKLIHINANLGQDDFCNPSIHSSYGVQAREGLRISLQSISRDFRHLLISCKLT